ncbi:hypothetical protein Tco_1196080 [Tanacetum coccineum]
MLRVLGERPEENVKHLMSVKVEEPKLEDIAIVQNFSEVFPDDLSGLPPPQEVEFRIDLIPGAMSVAKSPYCLAPTKMEELSNQLKELDEVFSIWMAFGGKPLDLSSFREEMDKITRQHEEFKNYAYSSWRWHHN